MGKSYKPGVGDGVSDRSHQANGQGDIQTASALNTARQLPMWNNLANAMSGNHPATGMAGKALAPAVLTGGINNFDAGVNGLLDPATQGDGLSQTDAALRTAQGVGGVTAGTIGTLGGIGSLMSWIGGMGSGVAAGFGGGLPTALATGGSALTGATGAGALGMGTSVAAAGALPILAAGGAGLAGGIGLANRGDNYVRDAGLLGQNSDGTSRGWSDAGADVGMAAHDALGGGTLGMVGGLAATGVASIGCAAGAAITGAAGLATDLWDVATSW